MALPSANGSPSSPRGAPDGSCPSHHGRTAPNLRGPRPVLPLPPWRFSSEARTHQDATMHHSHQPRRRPAMRQLVRQRPVTRSWEGTG